MNRVLEATDMVNDLLGKAVSYFMLFMITFISWEVMLRYIFNRPTSWAHELTQLLFGAYCILGAGYTLSRPIVPHARMDIIYNRFSPRTQHLVDIISSLFLFLFVGTLVWKGWEAAWSSMLMWERSYTAWAPPIWFARFTIPIGCFLLLLQGAVVLIRDIAAFMAKKGVS